MKQEFVAGSRSTSKQRNKNQIPDMLHSRSTVIESRMTLFPIYPRMPLSLVILSSPRRPLLFFGSTILAYTTAHQGRRQIYLIKSHVTLPVHPPIHTQLILVLP